MKPVTFTIYELFERRCRHVVPLFQRPYVWTLDDQWKPLWEDIAAKSDGLLTDSSGKSRRTFHFMGAAVLSEMQTFGRQVKTLTIIDGQQRLTTLQIILVALRDFVRHVAKDDGLADELQKLTENTRLEDESERFKVFPTNADRAVFASLVKAKSHDEVERLYSRERLTKRTFKSRPTLVEAYLYFYEKIQTYVFDPNDDDDDGIQNEFSHGRLEALYQAISAHFQLVVIELEQDDNPQIIFETLNARGVPLLASDLIRNFIFLEAANNGENTEQLYEVYWKEFDEPANGDGFWKQEERQGRYVRPRLDLFIYYYLTLKTGRDITIPNLFQEFSAWWRSIGTNNAEDHLKELQYYAHVYRSLFDEDQQFSSRVHIAVRRLRDLEANTVFPLLLFLLGECENEIPQAERDGIMADLESYVLRRWVCGLPTNNYSRFFLSIVQNLSRLNESGKRSPVTPVEVRRLLTAYATPSGRFPTDDEFRVSWLGRPVYEVNRPRTRMVLEALDLQLTTSRQERVHLDSTLSIEHIYPQNPDPTAWSAPDNEDDSDKLDTLKHTFGNLTLLTQLLNASISNGAFDIKAREIAQQSVMRLNTYFQNVPPDAQWALKDIVQRGEYLFEIARHIWDYPVISD